MSRAAPTSIRENLSADEARARGQRIGVVSTEVDLDLDRGAEVFGSTTTLRFEVLEAGPTFVDLTARSIESIELDGRPMETAKARATRIPLPPLEVGIHELRVRATMAYRHEGKGLHRFVDPSDGRVYLHSQFEPFEAHLVYACFDQPDIKTTFALSVQAPAGWVVISNGAVASRPVDGQAGRWRFESTPRVSSYVTAVVAGPYEHVADTYRRPDGSEIRLGLYVRRSLAGYLDADEIFEVTRQGFATFESWFGQPYPFGSTYDQLFVPEFSAGAMENPGCVTFSETYVFRSKVTDALRERRAETILHEMAHMWFGDLVTMRWWDDLWLNESFATFMSILVQATATRWKDAWVTFLDSEKTWAKFQDQLPSTHPIAAHMPDVESVHQNFDGITYAKGASVLRQLVAWVGQDEFLAGCRDYFARHAWGNTELVDFLSALERTSGRDLTPWRDEWLQTTGVNRLAPRFEVDDDGRYAGFAVEQSAPTPSWASLPHVDPPRPELRRHRLAVGLYRRDGDLLVRDRRIELDVTGATTHLTELVGTPAADVVLVNDDDLTYAKAVLDPQTMAVVTESLAAFAEPLPRALVWAYTWDMLRDGELPARRFVDLLVHNVAAEDQVGVLQRLLHRGVGAVERYGDPANAPAQLARLADHARAALDATVPGSDHQLAWARHWALVARDGEHLGDVSRLLAGDLVLDGLTVDADLRWHLVTCLARAGAADERDIDAELMRDDTDLGRRHAATARAARPDAVAKHHAWTTLLQDTSLSHTMSRQLWGGFLQLDQADLLAPWAERYFEVLDDVWADRSLDWAIEFSEGVFPHPASSPQLLGRVDAELARDDLPRPLRRVLLEQRDTLVRTLAARACDAAEA